MAKINKEKQATMPQELLHELFDYNAATGCWTNKTDRSSRARKGQPAGCLDKSTGYLHIHINGYTHLAHRLAWVYVYGDYPDEEQPFIDHINGKRDDNRISNLKVSSHGENQRNQKKNSTNISGITGVFRVSALNGSRTKLNWYWRANWYNGEGKGQWKDFSIHKLGEEKAELMAISHRLTQIALLESEHNVKYSERHGT